MALAYEVFNSSSAASVSSSTIALNTSGVNRIALIFVLLSDVGSGIPQVTSVSDANGLTWAKYTDFTVISETIRMEVWWAYAAAQQTANTVTVTSNVSSRGFGLGVGAISGVPATRFTTPFDADPSLPSTASNPSGTPANASVTFSTHDAQTVGLATWISIGVNTNNTTTPSGWTILIDLNFNGTGSVAHKLRVFAQVYSAQQVNTVADFGSVVHWGLSLDAVGGNFIFPHQQAISAGW